MNWYAFHCRSNTERLVADALAERGIESYWPSFRAKQQHRVNRRAQEHEVERALFPGYVFGRFALAERERALHVRHVVRILGFGDQPVAIPDHEIAAVRLIMSAPTAERHPYISLGAYVRVTHGPLVGLEGFVTVLRGQCRVVVSLNMLQRSVASEVDASSLEVVPQKAAA